MATGGVDGSSGRQNDNGAGSDLRGMLKSRIRVVARRPNLFTRPAGRPLIVAFCLARSAKLTCNKGSLSGKRASGGGTSIGIWREFPLASRLKSGLGGRRSRRCITIMSHGEALVLHGWSKDTGHGGHRLCKKSRGRRVVGNEAFGREARKAGKQDPPPRTSCRCLPEQAVRRLS